MRYFFSNRKIVISVYILFSIFWIFLFSNIYSKNHESDSIYLSLKLHEVIFVIVSLIVFYLIFFIKRPVIDKESDDNKLDNFINYLKEDCFYFRHTKSEYFEYISPSIKNQLGVDEEFFRNNLDKFNANELINDSVNKHSKLYESGIVQPSYEVFLYDYAGKILNFQIREFPIIKNNKVIGVDGIAHNITEFKKIESELKEKENKYQILFESANDAILIMKGGYFIDCNKKALEMFGCSYEQIIMQSPLKFSPNKQLDGQFSKEKAEEKISEALNGRTQSFQWTHNRLDGKLFEAEVTLSAFKFIDQNFIQAIVRDVDERIKNELLLKESEEKFRNVTENTVSAIFIIQNDSYMYINESAIKLTGYSSEELKSMNFWELIHPDFKDLVKERGLARQRGENIIDRYEFKIISKTGSEIWIDFTANIIDYNNSKAILGTAFDISERKNFEIEIANSKKILQNTINALPDMLTVIDRNYKVVVSNWKDHDYITEEMKQSSPYCYECYFNRKTPCDNCGADYVIKTKKILEYETVNKVDGILREIKVFPIFDETGEVEMVVQYIKNISKIKTLQSKNEELINIIDKIEINNDILFFNYSVSNLKFDYISNGLIDLFNVENIDLIIFKDYEFCFEDSGYHDISNAIISILNLEKTFVDIDIPVIISEKSNNYSIKLYSIISDNKVKSIIGNITQK